MIVINDYINVENHRLIFATAESLRKRRNEPIVVKNDVRLMDSPNDIAILPDHLIIAGALTIMRVKLQKLPEHLTIDHDLTLMLPKGNILKELPAKLTVGKRMFLYDGCQIEHFPKSLRIGQRIEVDISQMELLESTYKGWPGHTVVCPMRPDYVENKLQRPQHKKRDNLRWL